MTTHIEPEGESVMTRPLSEAHARDLMADLTAREDAALEEGKN